MLIAVGVILFALGLLFSIAWHELGHLTFAKVFKVRTTQYMVGFGKTIWSRRRGETEYGIKAIPLGGYIRMVGMIPPEKLRKDGSRRRFFRAPSTTVSSPFGMFRQMIADTRANDRAEVIEEIDDGRQFYQLHPFKRIVIMFAGPFMNLILAVVLFGIVLVGFGVPTPVPTVAQVSECILSAEVAQTRTTCTDADPKAPAAESLQVGDRFISIDGVAIADWDQLRGIIAADAGDTITVVVERDGQQVSTEIDVIQTVRNVYDENDQVIGTETVGVIGVSPATPYVSQSAGSALEYTGDFIARAAHGVIQIPARIPALWDAIFSDAPRDVNTPVGIVGAGRISGEILNLDTDVTDKVVLFLQLLAGFNMSLFLINLLPLLPLDGGHIFGAVIEWIRRGFAKIAKRPDPGPFDVAKLMPVAYVVALLFIGLTVLTLVADVVNPVKLFG